MINETIANMIREGDLDGGLTDTIKATTHERQGCYAENDGEDKGNGNGRRQYSRTITGERESIPKLEVLECAGEIGNR